MTHNSFREYVDSWRALGGSINYNKYSNFKMSFWEKLALGFVIVGSTTVGGWWYMRRKSEERKVKRVLRKEEQEAERLARALGRIETRKEKEESRLQNIVSKIL